MYLRLNLPAVVFISGGNVKTFGLLSLFFLCTACNTISVFDKYSYKETISAKIESLALMDKATESYNDHEAAVETLTKSMLKIYEYEKHRTRNNETLRMWEIILDPGKHLLSGFFVKWKSDDHLNKAFIDQVKIQVEKGFDIIIDLENKKIKPGEASKAINEF